MRLQKAVAFVCFVFVFMIGSVALSQNTGQEIPVPAFEDWVTYSGDWSAVDGMLVTGDPQNPNTNAFAVAEQPGGKLWYEWTVQYGETRARTAPSAGMHILADDPTAIQRGTSYLIWQDLERMVVYRAAGGGMRALQAFPLPALDRTKEFTYYVTVDTDVGVIEVFRDDEFIGRVLDPEPIKQGRFLSVRTSETIAMFQQIRMGTL